MGAIDATTGALKLDDYDTAIGPHLGRAAFLAAPVGQAARDLTVNEPWHSWKLACRIGGEAFMLALYFHGETLDMAVLALSDGRYGTSWDDYSEDKEKARHAAHRRWIDDELKRYGKSLWSGSRRTFPWGAVSADYDPRSGGASIVITYGRR